jgi:mannose-6-phosphate isomerase-like protein (cupin superfamily)
VVVRAASLSETEIPRPRGGEGSIFARQLLAERPGSAIKGLVLNRLPPGCSIGLHSHHGEEDFYYCISGQGVVTDNGNEVPFVPGTFQMTGHNETQALRNTGTEDLVFLGALVSRTDRAS